MQKKFILLSTFSLLIFFSYNFDAQASGDAFSEEEASPFHKMPQEVICSIADYLEGENKEGKNDFASFALTSKYTYGKIKSNPLLFAPVDKEEITQSIKNCPFEELEILSYKWSRSKKPFLITQLNEISEAYKDHNYVLPMNEIIYKEKMRAFKIDVKAIILGFMLGDKDIEKKMQSIKVKKVFQYRLSTPIIERDMKAIRLQIFQAAIISKDIIEYIQNYRKSFDYFDYSEVEKEAIAKKEKYKFINDFFKNITSQEEKKFLPSRLKSQT